MHSVRGRAFLPLMMERGWQLAKPGGKSVRVVYHAGASATKLSFALGLHVVNVFI